MKRALVALGVALVLVPSAAAASAPGGPGAQAFWTTGAKQGIAGTPSGPSNIWATLADGTLSEVYWPRLDLPQTADLELVVTDGSTFSDRERDATRHDVQLLDAQALEYRQTDTAVSGRYQIVKTTITDPLAAVVLVDVQLESLDGGAYRAYVLFDPSLAASGAGDSGSSQGDALLASDGPNASALVCSCAFPRTSSGYAGASDGWTDLRGDRRMDWTYDVAPAGNVVQLADTGGATRFTLALGFGPSTGDALSAARQSLARGFSAALADYEHRWHDYLSGLPAPPVAPELATQYRVALMALKASEDRSYPGASVASPTIPWGQAVPAAGSAGGYHLVWARDLYQVATAELAAGDAAAAGRALDYLLNVQQNRDGSFPQNSTLDGKPVFPSLQLDEVAFPLILAWQLGRADAQTWRRHLRPAADLLVTRGPATPEERWEEARGFSPSTIAAEIAGLVCAADAARRNGDRAAEGLYLGTADDWARKVDRWTYTSSGPLPPHYERIDDDGKPGDGHALGIANGGGTYDERTIVDAGFLELVRLGIKAPGDPKIAASLKVVDSTIKAETPNGAGWYRYNHDGYGEGSAGSPYQGGGAGRLWPLLTGERGEFAVAAGAAAQPYLAAMAGFANDGYLIPEQVWDRADAFGFRFGEGTGSATPLEWSMAQFVRLAVDAARGKLVEQPAIVAARYVDRPLAAGPLLAVRAPRPTRAARVAVAGRTSATLVVVAGDFGRDAVRVRGGTFRAPVKLGIGRNTVTIVAVGTSSTSLRRLTVARRP